ncbi:polysaccharide deacetylase family protein [Sporosarcina sp.]|uniref:polysaccharide deacetylase family protein n=1 Tax=Sporosarcina sp. TaxID=49982 RepID=UPI00261699A1|nr:polysaccharide deacetylase family protein [Sporosarcina sp.]
MKRMIAGVLIIGVLFLLAAGSGLKWGLPFVNEQHGKVFAQLIQKDSKTEFEKVLILQERQPMYMRETTLVKIGELEAGQPVAIMSEDEDYYELRLGKMSAYVRKGQSVVEKRKLQTVGNTERLGAVNTLRQTIVYESADLQSDMLMQLEKGYRYPVVQEQEDWYIIKIGERPGYIHKQSVDFDEGLPVLVYHQVLPRELMTTELSTVSLESFEQQMDYLADQQFHTLTSRELFNYLEGRLVVPSKAIIITFDDGLLSSKEYAYPVLKKYGFTAPHHIISSRMDRGHHAPMFAGGELLKYITAEDLPEMEDVFHFEAHTDELHQLTDDREGFALHRTTNELVKDLQNNLKQVPGAVSIAYPYGHYNDKFVAAAKEVGLLIGFTTTEGYANMDKSNYEVNRFGITEKRPFEDFVVYVDGNMTWP